MLLSSLLTPSTTKSVSNPTNIHALTTTVTNSSTSLFLQKRDPPFSIHNLYLQRTAHLTMLFPTLTAARALADFYAEIHVRCITSWMQNLPPPQADLILRLGGFQLSFVACDGSSEGISWEFIRDFTAVMLRFTKMGYTGVYDQGWWNAARTLGVYVGLRVVEMGDAGAELVVVSPS